VWYGQAITVSGSKEGGVIVPETLSLPNLGHFDQDSGLVPLKACSDGAFRVGEGGVTAIAATGDGKLEFIAFADRTLAYVRSALGYPAYYPVHPVALERPVKAVLMDLDGTSVPQ
jgi:beta-phosphoglucomutase